MFKTQSGQKRIGIIWRWAVAVILIFFSLFPVLWIFSASINPSSTLGAQRLIPQNAGLDNYKFLFEQPAFPFPLWFLNSVKIASISTVLSVSITLLAAYAFSRFRFRGRETMLKGILLVQVFPGALAMVALFLIVQQLGDQIAAIGLNTHAGLILVYMGGAMGINIWLMKGFFDSIPRDIDESAMVDGATHWQIFWQLLVPLMRPILIVIAIITLIGV